MDTIDGFADSYEITNTSSSSFLAPMESSIVYPPAAELLNKADVSALQLLSNTFESVFDSPESLYSDAKLVLSDGREVSFHRFVLSARSPFFKNVLAADNSAVKLKLNEIAKDYEVGYDSVVTVLAYVYSSRVRPPPKGVSECADENCCHVACRPAVDFMLEVLYLAFVFKIPELVTLYQMHLLDVVDKVVIEDNLVILKLANICGEACKQLLDKCIDIIVRSESDVDIVSLDKSLPEHIAKQIVEICKEFGLEAPEVEKRVSNLHRALDADDVELVKLLLAEGHTNLDNAYALHYAVAYCDVKTAMDLLNLDLADVNHRNPRGYTVLHVAAMRKEPQLILSLLSKGANPSETSLEGRTALLIAKQVTKAVEYNNVPEQHKHSRKGRLCLEILEQADKRVPIPRDAHLSLEVAADELKIEIQEQAEKRDPIPRDVPPSLEVPADELKIEIQEQTEKRDPIPRDVPPSLEVPADELKIEIQEQTEKRDPIPRDVPPSLEVPADELKIEIQEQAEKRDPIPRDVPPSLEVPADELKMRLLGLENRVACARHLFPMEAQVAMEIAQINETCDQFIGFSLGPDHHTGAKTTSLDVKIEPFEILEGQTNRLKALSKTVELGKRFFPRCSEVLDKILESDDLDQLAFGEEENLENRVQKRTKYMEIQETIKKAFSEDKGIRKSKSRCFTVMAFLVVINLFLEIASAVADQLSSIHKPYFTRISLVMSILSVVLSIIDLAYKIRDHKARFRCKWPIPWFYYPSRGYNRIFGSFTDMVLLFCVVGGLVVSTINYSFIERRRDGPIKVSIWPLFFAIGMVASKFMEKPTISKDHYL